MNEVITQTRRFNWNNWLFSACRWMTIAVILVFVSKTGVQNGAFDDVLVRLIAVVGFVGYIMFSGIKLVTRNSSEFWIYED